MEHYTALHTTLDCLCLTVHCSSNTLAASLAGDRWDAVAEWWTKLLSCASLWCANRMEEAEALYQDIDNLPQLYRVRTT